MNEKLSDFPLNGLILYEFIEYNYNTSYGEYLYDYNCRAGPTVPII